MAIEERVSIGSERWSEHPGEDWSDAIVQAMKLGGVDNLFFVSGSEIAFYQEAIAKARQRGWPAPRLLTVTHEGVALHAAAGNVMVSGQPAATACHVDVGTINYGAAVHTAWRGPYSVLMTAGTGPRAFPGSMPGARDNAVQWVQEPRDQGEIVRQYTKADHRMEYQDNPGLMISRLLQLATTEPAGPVYVSIPREVAFLPTGGSLRFPTRAELGVSTEPWPDPTVARQVAEWLVKADNPVLLPGKSGRNPASVEPLVRLAELLAIPVSGGGRMDRLCFPTTHPLFGTGPSARDADVVVVIENPAPWIAGREEPRPGAKIVWVDVDPVQSRYKTMEYDADVWIPSTTAAFANAVYEAATGMLSQSDLSRIADRRARSEERKQAQLAEGERRAQEASKRNPIHPRWVGYQIGQILEPDSIVLDDGPTSSPHVQAYHRREQTGTYFRSGGSTGGWGIGAAFGAKLARPQSDVVLAVGDGYMMFGTPLAALWAAEHYKAGFLAVVFVNRSYSTGTNGLRALYPEGVAVESGDYEGGVFDPPPNFAKLAEAANGYGESVAEPDQVGPALRRGLQHARNGTPAIIAVQLPTHVEELTLGS
jgi:acetolactate synthase I/II/III large subunit